MSLNFHEGVRFQRGRGIGSILGGLFRWLRPMASMGLNVGKKILSSDLAKKLGKTAVDIGKSAASNMAVDLLEGKAFKDTAAEQINEAKKTIATTLKGGGRKRKGRKICKPCKKGRYSLLE